MKVSFSAAERAFAEIAATLARLSARISRAESQLARKSSASAPKRRSLHINAERRAQLKLQGAYMGYMRQLGPRQKARVKAVKEKRGVEAAIKVAKGLAGK